MSTSSRSVEEVRVHVLDAHARLRARAAELALNALATVREKGHRDVPALVAELAAAVEECDELEERELVPLLIEADPWGPARIEKLRESHARHLGALRSLADELADGVDEPLRHVERIEEVVRLLLVDLDEEERLSLEPDVLGRDDPIVVGQTSG
jgi:hypothetical protein